MVTHAELRRRATEYAGTLMAGDELHDDIDGATVEPFRDLLPDALAARGMRMVAMGCDCCDGEPCEEDEPMISRWRIECDHASLRAMDQGAFREATVIVGYQPDGDGGFLELGTHLACGSTLAIQAERSQQEKAS
jgi:hypothetical protein